MSDVRAQRDRRLIQRTATLLSEEYPLAVLIERLCNVLCTEFDADIAFVALAHAGEGLRVEGFACVGGGEAPDISPASAARVAFDTGTVSNDGQTLALPIVYRERILGVLVLAATRGVRDEQDIRLISAVARYLGAAIRNQRPVGPLDLRGPRSWQFGVAGGIAIAVLLTIAIMILTAVRVDQSHDQGMALANGRLRQIVEQFDDYVLDARQLAVSTANLAATAHDDAPSLETTLVSMLLSARSPQIYGIGAWYEPYAFDGKTRYFGPYAHWDRQHRPLITHEWMRPAYDFHHQPWYRAGRASGEFSVFTDPYFDTDHVYVTAAHVVEKGGRIRGVVTVDSIVPTLAEAMVALAPGDFATITTRAGHVAVASSSGKERLTDDGVKAERLQSVGADAISLEREIPYIRWTAHLYVARAVFDADARRLQGVAAVAIGGIWLAAFVAIFVSFRSRKHLVRVDALESQRRVLESEIAERVRAEERLREYAYRDDLTGLPNRASLMRELAAVLHHGDDGKPAASMFFIDIDRFNIINDSLGHSSGDRLLIEFGERLRSHTRGGEVLARLGGDEFVLLSPMPSAEDARRRAAAIQQSLRHPFTISGVEIFVSASIGIAVLDERYELPEELLRDADAAMYEAKRAGRATCRVFDRSMHDDALEKLALETDLRRGLERGEIFAEFQPIISLADGRLAGFEALARWRHPSRGRVMPDTFIKIAEQSGLIVEIDERILSMACVAARSWLDDFPDAFVAVNLSAAHLARIDDLSIVRRALEGSGIPASSLKVEITESAIMENGEKSAQLLAALRELGVRVAIDDFGTGYSSLSHLQRLPVEELKIDRSFIGTMMNNERAAEIVRAILAIAKTLHMSVTAEGIERDDQQARLTQVGVEYGQGYLFGMPVEADMALRLLRTRLKTSLRV